MSHIHPAAYVRFVAREYLDDFVARGGSAVKFAVPQDGLTAQDVVLPLAEEAKRLGFVFTQVDARSVRVHMIDKLFHEIARQVPWDDLAQHVAARALAELAFGDAAARSAGDLDLESIAAAHGYMANELRREFNRKLQELIYQDYEMTQEFRLAMIRLCQARVDHSPAAQAARLSVLEWLTGDLTRITALRDAQIFQRINRANARAALFSLARWAASAGRRGLVFVLDIAQLAVPRRDAAGDGLFYTKASVLDAYEVLRQFIDGTDELSHTFVLVTCAPEFVTDPARGLEAYHALRLRIRDEVRDRRRTNPLGALVRLSPLIEPAVPAGGSPPTSFEAP